jgi:hypothetical protein
MRTKLKDRSVRFTFQDGCLVRVVVGGDRTYTHRCSKEAFETVAHAINDTPAEGRGTTLTFIARHEDVAYTQVNVALEFLKERGIVDVRHRRSYPATTCPYEDAMVEFHALAEEPKPA